MNTLNKKKIIKGICFVVIFAVLFYFCQRLLQAKWVADNKETSASTSAWQEYRSLEEDTVDILFMGTSHVFCGIDPMYMYGQSGITSYVLAGERMRLDMTYIALEDALKTQSPSVLFLDISAIHYKSQVDETMGHKTADQLPISISKIEYAFNNENDDLKPLDVLFPLFRYHTRWESLEENDFKYAIDDLPLTYVRGHDISYKITPTELGFEEDHKFTLSDRDSEYMNRIVELCKENNIELVLFKIPAPEWYKSQSQGAQELADELGLTYLELYYDIDEMGLDSSVDYRDKKDHVNQTGAEKVTQYMLDYIEENYDLQDQRETNQRWNSDYEKYKALVQSQYDAYYSDEE